MISGFSFICRGSDIEKYGFLFRLFDKGKINQIINKRIINK
jgi:hypothetical protein